MPGVPVRVLVLGNELLAAAGVAGQGVGTQRVVRGDQPQLDQGIDGRDEAGGMTAGVGDSLGMDDRLPVLGGEFGEAVGPALRRPVGGGGVDDLRVGVLDHGHGFAGRVVGQAEEDQIRRIETFFALGGVLPLLLVDEEKLDVLAGGQPVIDLQAGGALPSVNKNHRFHGHARSWMKCLMFSIWTFTASGAGPP